MMCLILFIVDSRELNGLWQFSDGLNHGRRGKDLARLTGRYQLRAILLWYILRDFRSCFFGAYHKISVRFYAYGIEFYEKKLNTYI